MNGKKFILSSPSGCGKSTLRDMLIDSMDSINKVITCTSRPIRMGEVDGTDYIFKNIEDMINMQANGEFVESVMSFGNMYATPKNSITESIENGKNVLLIIDSFGKIEFDKHFDTVGIFINPPPVDILIDRLSNRGDIDIQDRIDRVYLESSFAKSENLYKYYIDNEDDIMVAFELLKKIITDEL